MRDDANQRRRRVLSNANVSDITPKIAAGGASGEGFLRAERLVVRLRYARLMWREGASAAAKVVRTHSDAAIFVNFSSARSAAIATSSFSLDGSGLGTSGCVKRTLKFPTMARSG